MYPELFHIGSFTIYSYGLMMALAFIVGLLVARRYFIEHYIRIDYLFDLLLAAVIGGIVGARLFYVIGHWSYFAKHPGEIIRLNMEGLVFYGGLLFGVIAALVVGHLRHLKFSFIADLAGLSVPLALAVGRIGCLLNGCCYGKKTGLPWGITFPQPIGGPRHPTQIYELILDVLLFAVLWWARDKFDRGGEIFVLSVSGYAVIRFSMEFLREHAVANANLTFQLISAAVLVVAITIFLFRYRILPPKSIGSGVLVER